jgi:hypothetical protein
MDAVWELQNADAVAFLHVLCCQFATVFTLEHFTLLVIFAPASPDPDMNIPSCDLSSIEC